MAEALQEHLVIILGPLKGKLNSERNGVSLQLSRQEMAIYIHQMVCI